MKVSELQRVLKTYLKPDDEIAIVWFQKSDFEYEEDVTDETWVEAVTQFDNSSWKGSIDSETHQLIESIIMEVTK